MVSNGLKIIIILFIAIISGTIYCSIKSTHCDRPNREHLFPDPLCTHLLWHLLHCCLFQFPLFSFKEKYSKINMGAVERKQASDMHLKVSILVSLYYIQKYKKVLPHCTTISHISSAFS